MQIIKERERDRQTDRQTERKSDGQKKKTVKNKTWHENITFQKTKKLRLWKPIFQADCDTSPLRMLSHITILFPELEQVHFYYSQPSLYQHSIQQQNSF